MGYKKMDQNLGFAELALASSIILDRINQIKRIGAPGDQKPGNSLQNEPLSRLQCRLIKGHCPYFKSKLL